MKTSIKYTTIIGFAALTSLSACRKDEDPPAQTPTPTPTSIKLELEHKAGSSALVLNSNLTDAFGTVFTISRADFYVNGFAFTNDMGDTILNHTPHYIVRPDVTEIVLGNVSGTHAHEMSFNIGVDPASNLSVDPATQPAGSALGVQTPSMYWSWSSGYRFVVIEGNADRNADGVPESMYQFHIGMNSLYKAIELHLHQDLTANASNTVHIEIDYLRFFDGINMSLSTSHTHTMDNMPLATQFMNNADSVFSVHVH